jgi:hypothetical protein
MRRIAIALLAAFTLSAAGAEPSPASATPPSVVLTSPSGTLRGTVTLNASVTGAATEVRYFADGVQVGLDSSCCDWAETWNTAGLSEGQHVLTATAKNAAGEIGTSAPVTVTVDNVPDTTTTTLPPTTTTTVPPTTTEPAPTTTTAAPTTTTTVAPTTTTAPPPSGGCPAGWYQSEGQSWWWQPSFGGDPEYNARHLHVGGCIPHRTTTLSGTVPFTVTVKMHHNPGKVYYVAVVFKTDSMETSYKVDPGWTCPTMDCTFTHTFNLPMSNFDKAGLQEIRFRASDRQSDLGTEIRASINFQANIANGKTVNPIDRQPYLRGKGWYSDMLYCEADYRTDLTPIPTAPVSGTWSPVLRQVDHNAGDAPLSRHTVRIDPNIHGGYKGLYLVDAPGQREGPLAIDTTQLSNGEHKLMVHSECADSEGGLNGGVLIVPFTVANP